MKGVPYQMAYHRRTDIKSKQTTFKGGGAGSVIKPKSGKKTS